MQKYITQITRTIRVLRVTLGHAKSRMPIQILSTYAPRNGHSEEERRQKWEEFKEIINATRGRHFVIWFADANGQLGRDEEREEEENPHRAMPPRE